MRFLRIESKMRRGHIKNDIFRTKLNIKGTNVVIQGQLSWDIFQERTEAEWKRDAGGKYGRVGKK